jgi:hypothetical protein
MIHVVNLLQITLFPFFVASMDEVIHSAPGVHG